MKVLKKVLILTITLIIIINTLTCSSVKAINDSSNTATRKPVEVGVLLYSYDNVFSDLIRKSLEDIQKENENKVEFTFFDGKNDYATEHVILNNMIQDNFDLIVACLVDRAAQEQMEEIINKVKQKNIPLILFKTNPSKLNVIKGYPKAIVINTDVEQSGVLQGKIIAETWNKDKETLDKNGDGIMQYIMIRGKPDSYSTIARTKYSIETINNAGIETEELASVSGDWDEELAKSIIESLFFRYESKIEVIIANNDSAAIGAIEALQKYGYNMGDKSKYISVFGIDAIPEAQDLIKKGFMAGTVLQDPVALAEAIYTVGMNLVSGKNPIEGTNYKFDKTGVILLPHKEYPSKNEQK